MKKFIIIFAIGVPLLSYASETYRYNELTGLCESTNGDNGLNAISFQTLKETGNGECANLRGAFIQDDTGTPNRNWNLKGANLNKTEVQNLILESADLRGAKMESMTGVYSYFEGRADVFTRLPNELEGGHPMGNIDRTQGFPSIAGPRCTVENGHMDCGQY